MVHQRPCRDKRALEIDTEGNTNLAIAAHRAGVRRFVLVSILTADQTPDVPHFWHKKLTEDKLEALEVPFVALRPGAFLDQLTRMGGDPFEKKRLTWFGTKTIPLTFVLTSDLAGYLAAAVDADVADGERIDIGWGRPVSMQDIADIASTYAGGPVSVRSMPAWFVNGLGAVMGPFVPMVKDMSSMLGWFETGKYVADTRRQGGSPRTSPDAGRRRRALRPEFGALRDSWRGFVVAGVSGVYPGFFGIRDENKRGDGHRPNSQES